VHELPDPPRARISAAQCRRRHAAARTLAASRMTDLAALDAASSIKLIEELRAALDEVLRILDECTG
jgi:hypothetical protein